MKYLGYSELTKRLYILPSSARQPKIDITEDVQEYIDFTLKGNGFSLEDMAGFVKFEKEWRKQKEAEITRMPYDQNRKDAFIAYNKIKIEQILTEYIQSLTPKP